MKLNKTQKSKVAKENNNDVYNADIKGELK